jgi:hypothetical protein
MSIQNPRHSHAQPKLARAVGPRLCTLWLTAALGCGGSEGAGTTDQAASAGSGSAPTTGASPSATGSTTTPAAGSRAASGSAGSRAAQPLGSAGKAASTPSAGSSPAGAAGTQPSSAAHAGSSAAEPGAAEAGAGATPAAGSGEAGAGPSEPGAAAGPLADTQALIPDASWTCNMPDGIPAPASGELVFEIDFTVAEVRDLGQTHFGHRTQIDVSGGTVTGAMLNGTLADRGLDYQLTLDNGVVELEQIHILRAGSSPVYMRNCGLAPSEAGPVRVVLDFEAPSSSAASWLNEGTYIGVRDFDAAAKSLKMKVYKVDAAADKADAVLIPAAPPGPHNTWECKKASGSQGSVVYTETVGIGGSVAVGASKRGTRNIIPITGGTTSGMIQGGVLSGGADFQLSNSAGFELDARYTLETDDGELIIVRNCGIVGSLVPVFEAKKDGKYAWINEGDYLSSDPGITVGAVNLTIYEKR